ncbi:putative zinc-binding metallopeptidase [Ureibacillus composti]
MKYLRWLLLYSVILLTACGDQLLEEPVTDVIKPSEEAIVEENETYNVTPSSSSMEEVTQVDNGCFSDEIYIENEDICTLIIECSDYITCVEWGNDVVTRLEFEYGSLVLEESVATDDDGLTVLKTYNVDNEQEVITTDSDVTDEELAYHGELWFSFSWIIPEKYREEITRFEVFESGNTLAYVSLHDDFGEYWTLGMNNENIELASETLVTYLHEYSHFLSLNFNEVDYWEDEASCPSLFLKNAGCLYEDAYLTGFYLQFWESGASDVFEGNYVSEYAMTSPEEDFAETFAHFVLTETPKGNSVVDEKILFFYQYEELVEMRTEILSRTATWLKRSVEK